MAGVSMKPRLLQSNFHKRCVFKTLTCKGTACYSTVSLQKPYISRFSSAQTESNSELVHIGYMKNLHMKKVTHCYFRTFSSGMQFLSSHQDSLSAANQEHIYVLQNKIPDSNDLSQSMKDLENPDIFSHSLPTHSKSLQTSMSQNAASNRVLDLDQTSSPHSIGESNYFVDDLLSSYENDNILSSIFTNKYPSFLEYFIPTVNAASDVDASDAYGWLSTYIHFFENLAASTPVLKLMTFLQEIHAILGTPWWLSIILTTVILRTAITLPLAFYQQRILAKVELLKSEMMSVMPRLANETRVAKKQFGWDEQTAQLYFRKLCRKSWNELIVRDNCHPGKGVILLIGQLPLWIMLSVSFRNLALCHPVATDAAVATQQQFRTEGLPWCPDLSVSDMSLVLPLSMALINLIITEITVLQRPQVATTAGVRRMTWVLRGMAVIIVPIAIHMPAGVVLYWVTSSGCALGQTLLLMHPRVRMWSGIPLTPSTQLQPYSRIAYILAMKIRGQKIPQENTSMSFELPVEKKKLK